LYKASEAGQRSDIAAWSTPPLHASATQALRGAPQAGAHLLTAEQLDELQQQVHKEADERGFAEGLSRGEAEIRARIASLSSLTEALARPFRDLDEQVESAVANLAVRLAETILRREFALDPLQLVAALSECMHLIPGSVREVFVRVNPDDADLLAEYDAGQRDDQRVHFERDASLSRGSLIVSGDPVTIDGSLGARLNDILAAALERAQSESTRI
jgi:flagellar assembly protein FliH